MLAEPTSPLHHSNTPVLLFSDYHTHPQGNGTRRYSQELLRPWADAARKAQLRDIAFTDHDRFHAGVDFDAIEQLREKNSDLKIRAGIELDNDPATSAAGRKWVEANWDRLDFVLGSIHYLDDPTEMFDTIPDGAGQFVGRHIDEIYAEYFRRIREIAATGLIDCLSHLDLIKIHGHRPCGDVRSIIDETLEFIRSRDLAIELSTAGWRKPVNELYPSDAIIRLALEKGIPFTTASDAHSHAQLGEDFPRLAEKMSILGVREVCVYEKHKREVWKL
jgi:histidinol-phosphatase (PHP family)